MNHLRFLIFCSGILLLSLTLNAQNISISDNPAATPDANAVLDVSSSTKGVLFPRLSTAQRTALGSANPQNGTLVFDSEKNTYWYWVNGGWVELAGSGSSTVPVGTILTYAGAVTDDGSVIEVQPGYLLCNGAEITGLQYATLKNVLSTAWGNGSDSDPNTVNLPDLRGMFLRGVDGIAGTDPDRSSRTAIASGGNTGNKVGSYQDNATTMPTNKYSATTSNSGAHTHNLARGTTLPSSVSGKLDGSETIAAIAMDLTSGSVMPGNEAKFSYALQATTGTPNIGSSSSNGNHTHTITISGGDTETRPKNAYVNYIIKY